MPDRENVPLDCTWSSLDRKGSVTVYMPAVQASTPGTVLASSSFR